jgi:hypothetical protein
MTIGVQSRKNGTSKGSENIDGGDGATPAALLTKLDKSGLYDQQQVKRLLDDQVVAVRIVLDISRILVLSSFERACRSNAGAPLRRRDFVVPPVWFCQCSVWKTRGTPKM